MTRKKVKRGIFAAAALALVAASCSVNTAGTRVSGMDTLIGVEDAEPESRDVELVLTPDSNTAPPPEKPEISSSVASDPAIFDTDAIAYIVFNDTKKDVINFVNRLNSIIKARKYNEWRRYLDDDYYNFINSPEYLQAASNSGILAAKKIVLTNTYDYFINVVIPARSNGRVDDIEFINSDRVKAIAIYDGARIILYTLEKRQDDWKIVMPD
jgi:hypothetical protein